MQIRFIVVWFIEAYSRSAHRFRRRNFNRFQRRKTIRFRRRKVAYLDLSSWSSLLSSCILRMLAGCAAWSCLAFLHELDAPLPLSCISTRTWCSVDWSSLAFLHELDAPLLDLAFLQELDAPLLGLLLHFYMFLMLRCLIFSCMSTWT